MMLPCRKSGIWSPIEMMDRRFRDTVFAPVLRMFDDPARVKDRLVFPRSALPLIWKALKEEAPDQVSMVERLLEGGHCRNPDRPAQRPAAAGA